MHLKLWSVENEETENKICFVPNSISGEFKEFIEQDLIPLPIAAYRFPEQCGKYLDILALYLYKDEGIEIEFENIVKGKFYNLLTEDLNSSGVTSGLKDVTLIPDILQNTKIYIKLYFLGENLRAEVTNSSVLGSHYYKKFRSDWWNCDQELNCNLSEIKRLAFQLNSINSNNPVLANFFSSYIDAIRDTNSITSSSQRLTFLGSFLFSCSLSARKFERFNESLILIHRSLEYTLTRVCLDLGFLTERDGGFVFNNSIDIKKLVCKTSNLYNCTRVLEASNDISLSRIQLAEIYSINTSRNESKFAHGFMSPDEQTCEQFIDCVYKLSTSLLEDSSYWKRTVRKYSDKPKISISEMFSYEPNFSDYIIKII